jgi:hypothetical protein
MADPVSDRESNRAKALTEAAMTMLLLFVAIFAIFEGGRLIQTQQMLTDAARFGRPPECCPADPSQHAFDPG